MGVHSTPSKMVAPWGAASFLKKVTEVAPGIIYIYNQHLQTNEYANKSIGETLGYTSSEIQAMGSEFMPLVCHPEDLDAVVRHMSEVSALKDGEVAHFEYRVRHKDGRWIWLLSHDTIFDRAPDGTALRHIGIASDITIQKEAERKALAETLRATTTNDELCAFAYAMSHDLKAPSNTLNMLLSELVGSYSETMPTDATHLAEMARSTVVQMLKLIDDVMHYTKLIDGPHSSEQVDLGDILAQVLKDLEIAIREADAQVEIAPMPKVIGDPAQLHLLFQNLVENAVKFRSPGEPSHIKITSDAPSKASTCSVAVRDNGIGIHPAQLDKVFTIFKTLNAATEYPGSGLGLAICRRIAANHGSEITVSSKPGEGSCFNVELESA